MIILLLFLQKQNLANCFALDREIAVHVVLSLCGLCKCSTHDLKNNHSAHTHCPCTTPTNLKQVILLAQRFTIYDFFIIIYTTPTNLKPITFSTPSAYPTSLYYYHMIILIRPRQVLYALLSSYTTPTNLSRTRISLKLPTQSPYITIIYTNHNQAPPSSICFSTLQTQIVLCTSPLIPESHQTNLKQVTSITPPSQTPHYTTIIYTIPHHPPCTPPPNPKQVTTTTPTLMFSLRVLAALAVTESSAALR